MKKTNPKLETCLGLGVVKKRKKKKDKTSAQDTSRALVVGVWGCGGAAGAAAGAGGAGGAAAGDGAGGAANDGGGGGSRYPFVHVVCKQSLVEQEKKKKKNIPGARYASVQVSSSRLSVFLCLPHLLPYPGCSLSFRS